MEAIPGPGRGRSRDAPLHPAAHDGEDGFSAGFGAGRANAAAGESAGAAGRHRGRARSPWLRTWLWCEAAWRDFLYLVMPADCVVCGGPDQSLCPGCAAALRKQTAAPFRAEHSADALVGVSGNPLLPVHAAGEYRDALSLSILAFKNHGRTELGPLLARCLARVLAGIPLHDPAGNDPALHDPSGHDPAPDQPGPKCLLLVPIPSTGSGWRRRGYDPVALLLRALVREGRLPAGMAVAPLLRIKARLPWHRRHQKGLGRAARRRNVRNTMKIRGNRPGIFRLPANPNGYGIILVDDVLTTGSTLREGAKTLESAGLHVLAAVVLAAARAPSASPENEPGERLAENNLRSKDE